MKPHLITSLAGLMLQPALFAQAPTVAGVLNDASGNSFSPGMRAWIAGTHFGGAATAQVGGQPATVLDRRPWFGANGIIGDVLVIQIPVDLPAGPAPLEVVSGVLRSEPVRLDLASYAPAVVRLDGPVLGRALPDGRIESVFSYSCVRPEGTHVVYAVGLGATNPTVPDGIAAPATPLANTLMKPTVRIGDRMAEVVESVLAPGTIGSYRVSFLPPSSIEDGLHPLILEIGGKTAIGPFLAIGNALRHEWNNRPGAADSITSATVCGSIPGGELTGDPRNPPGALGGVTVTVTDSAGIARAARILAILPKWGIVQYVVPPDAANGNAVVRIATADGAVFTGLLNIQSIAPKIFLQNDEAPAGVVVRVRDGVQSVEQIAGFGYGLYFIPIDLGPETDQVFLLLFGTGLRSRPSLAGVRVRIDGVDAQVEYAGAQGELTGVDQVNVRLPRSLAGRGTVRLEVEVDKQGAFPGSVSTLAFK